MAKPRNLWPTSMQVWVITGEMASGKTTLGSAVLEIAREHGLTAEMVDGIDDAHQAERLLKVRTCSPDLLIMVGDEWPVANLPSNAKHLFNLSRGDAGRVHELARELFKGNRP
ncbi:hypothetical protein JW897_17875 [Chromobacterium alkanivorans]|uniref:hypothetical protein n=1 Tax=Chromobacterium alkanivorans TaxID=1071719 RepID=UPI0019677BFD|nr:hypothetical protein [Chromobacterium alkanivorans]MBN3005605.1 hypothetical protein [Chromobacterium alkanivorans]